MPYKVFISHAGMDTWVAQQIEAHVKNAGAVTFLDASNIDIGDSFEDEIFKQIRDSNEMVVLFTPWSVERPYVWLEIGAARLLEMRIVVVLHGMTIEDVSKAPKMPNTIKRLDVIGINELNNYFLQLRNRVISNIK